MSQFPNNLDPLPLSPPPPPSQRRSPQEYASIFGEYVRAIVAIVMWVVCASAALGLAYVAFRAIAWAVRTGTMALGV